MNITQLKYFQTVCIYGTVSAAAEYLYISQPSLSAAIKELEEEFGVALFRRHHKGMTLTEEGETLFKLSNDLLLKVEDIERIMNDMGVNKKILRLGVPPMIGSLILPKIFREFSLLAPDIQIEIVEAGSRQLLNYLDDGRIDAAFITHNTAFFEQYKSIPVSKFEIVCCTNKDSDLSNLDIVSAEQLKDRPIVMFKNSFFQTEAIKKWFSESNITPNVILQTDQLSTLSNIISEGVAVGFMFKQLISKTSSLIAIPTKTPINAQMSFVWRAKTGLFNSMKTFIEYIKTTKI